MAGLLVIPSRVAHSASTGSTGLFTLHGSGAGIASGDFVSGSAGLNTSYQFFIEVPPGIGALTVEIFDADIGLGGASEADAGRDRLGGGVGGFDTSVRYTLRDPSGAIQPTVFQVGDATSPIGADNAWLTLSRITGNSVLDQFETVWYSNNDGNNNNWSSDWIEVDAGGAGPASGAIQVVGGELRLQDAVGGQPSLEREADLLGTLGLNLTQAFLRFSFRTSNTLESTDQNLRPGLQGRGQHVVDSGDLQR